MTFRITGLSPEPFRHLYGLSEEALAAQGVRRVVADKSLGYPDRIELRDAEPGETLLLLNFTHQPAESPYRASHAIFVIEGARRTYEEVNKVPEVLRPRVLSLRAFDSAHQMIDADIVDGREVEDLIEKLMTRREVAYIHAHYAKRGCYAARIDREE